MGSTGIDRIQWDGWDPLGWLGLIGMDGGNALGGWLGNPVEFIDGIHWDRGAPLGLVVGIHWDR